MTTPRPDETGPSQNSSYRDTRSRSLQRMVRRFGFWVIGVGVHLLRNRLSGLGVEHADRTIRRDMLSLDSSEALAIANASGLVRVRPLHPDLDVSVGAANLFQFLHQLRDACRAHLDVGSEVIWGGKKATILGINRKAGIACVSVDGERRPAALSNMMPLTESKV